MTHSNRRWVNDSPTALPVAEGTEHLIAPHSATAAALRLAAGPPAVPDHTTPEALAAKAEFARDMSAALAEFRAWDAAGRPGSIRPGPTGPDMNMWA